LFFGYLVSTLERWIQLISISAGILIGLIFGFRRAWWFVAGILLGSLPIMLMRGLILHAIAEINLLQLCVILTIHPIYAVIGAWFGQQLQQPKKSSQH